MIVVLTIIFLAGGSLEVRFATMPHCAKVIAQLAKDPGQIFSQMSCEAVWDREHVEL